MSVFNNLHIIHKTMLSQRP